MAWGLQPVITADKAVTTSDRTREVAKLVDEPGRSRGCSEVVFTDVKHDNKRFRLIISELCYLSDGIILAVGEAAVRGFT